MQSAMASLPGAFLPLSGGSSDCTVRATEGCWSPFWVGGCSSQDHKQERTRAHAGARRMNIAAPRPSAPAHGVFAPLLTPRVTRMNEHILGHGPGLHSPHRNEWAGGARRQCPGPRPLLEAPFMARDHQAHIRQRCLRLRAVDEWPQYKALRQRYAGTRFEEQRQLHLPQKLKATVPWPLSVFR